MKDNQEVYYAKIMLFGEYGVICNSMGLTIPYAHFKGELCLMNDDRYTEYDFAEESNKQLREYYDYLKNIFKSGENKFKFDLDSFGRDLENGLYFESTIPQGYGIGSSGALCAALYSNYAINGISQRRFLTPQDIAHLKEVFSQMESYFHGTSSGIDPLLCYVKYPLLIKSRTDIEPVGLPRNKFEKNGAIFLINTGKQGKTSTLVNLFLDWCKQDDFTRFVKEEMIPTSDGCINALLQGEMKIFFKKLKQLSEYQLQYFKPMIPAGFEHMWQQGLTSGKYYLKLCGSGGGGFLLGLTSDYDQAREELSREGVSPVLVYRKT